MNREVNQDPVFSRLVEVERIPATGSHERIEANAEECAALAKLLQLPAIESLKAELHITPWRKQGFKIAGRFTANVRQICVVTLDPFDSIVEDDIERYYLRGNLPGSGDQVVTIEPLDDEDTEAFEGNTIDVGELVRESLTLALDPYPRKPGVVFSGAEPETGDGKANPFAVLEQMRKPN